MESMTKKIQMRMTHDVGEKCPSFLANPDIELILFGGKGGVGKTTTAVASAIHIAGTFPEKNILLASIDPAHSLQDSLMAAIEGCHYNGLDNLKILEINAEVSLKKFKERHQETLKTIASRGTFLDDEDISHFLSLSMPGLDEVMGIIDVIEFLKSSSCDMVVLDTAPTGHTLRFLDLPDTIQKWLKALDSMLAKHRYMKMLYARKYKKDEIDKFLEGMSKDVKRLSNLLRDKAKCEFVPVMIPEKLAIQETVRLLGFLKNHKIPVRNIIINQVYEYSACPLCKSRRFFQSKFLEEIECVFNRYNLIKIPLYRKEIRGVHALNEYRQNLGVVWRSVEDTDEGCGFRIQDSDINPQLLPDRWQAGANYMKAEAHTPPATSIQHRLSNIRGIGHLALPFVSLEQAQIILVGGKGGVGKTTLSCSTALNIRSKNPAKKVLLISTDPAHSLSDCLGIHVGENRKDLYENLHVLEINAQKEFEHLKNLYIEEIRNIFDSLLDSTMVDLQFDQDVMERLLDLSPPGLDEVMALTKIIDCLEKDKYDIFILDTAPTGHFIRFLELPQLIEDWLKVFFNIFLKYKNVLRVPKFKNYLVKMSKRIKKLRNILVDPEKTVFLPVSIPTEMALEETKDLICVVEKLKIYYPAILLNMVIPDSKCIVCSDIRKNQERVIKKYYKLFKKEKVHLVFHRDKEPRGLVELRDLGCEIFRPVESENRNHPQLST